MKVTKRLLAGVAIATAVTTAGISLTAQNAGAAVRGGYSADALRAIPTLTVHVDGASFAVTGPQSLSTGRVRLTATGAGHGGEAAILSFRDGYTFPQYRADVMTFGKLFQKSPKKALKLYAEATSKITNYGGVEVSAGKSSSMTTYLAPGAYVLYSDADGPASPFRFTVSGPATRRLSPTDMANVYAKANVNRFGGNVVLPARGTIRFTNRSTYSPHFLLLQQVAPATTAAQIRTSLAGNAPPSFVRSGVAGTDAISPGVSMTFTYSVPAGEYVELCFVLDIRTGMPHALMGMFRIVHLK